MTLDIIFTILGAALMIVGIIGCVVPALPGVPLNYMGIVLLHLTSRVQFSTSFLAIWAIIVILVQVFDYYIPIWGTKKLGGGKYGIWGSGIGIIAGIFIFPPWGIIIFPFAGAVIGELIDKKEFKTALKAGFGTFVGFIAGTLIKLTVAVILTFYFVKEVIGAFF